MGTCCCRYNDEKVSSQVQDSAQAPKPIQVQSKVLENTLGSVTSQAYTEMGSYFKIKAHQRQEKYKRKQSLKQQRNNRKHALSDFNYRVGSVNPGSLLSYEMRCPSKLIRHDPSKYLNLSSMNVSNSKLMTMVEERSRKSADVEVLNLANNKLNTQDVIRALSFYPGLTGYCFAQNKITELADIAKKLKNTRVKSLSLGGNPLDPDYVMNFAPLVKYLGIKSLGLAGLKLGDITAKHVIQEIQDANLSSLDLSYNNITSDGFQAMCQVGFTGECLFLCGNGITHINILAESLNRFPNLKNLDLRGNPISSKSLREILSKTTSKGVTLYVDSISQNEIRLLSAMHLFICLGPVLERKQQIYYPFLYE